MERNGCCFVSDRDHTVAYATNRQVVGSIPDDVIEFFQLT
jgi:hypothetical protein